MSDYNFSKMAKRISDKINDKASQALENLKFKTSAEVQKERFDICLSCDKLYFPTKTCRVCGCFMNLKTWMPEQSCPLKKWSEVRSSTDSENNTSIS